MKGEDFSKNKIGKREYLGDCQTHGLVKGLNQYLARANTHIMSRILLGMKYFLPQCLQVTSLTLDSSRSDEPQ
jgi:hypothetical protein